MVLKQGRTVIWHFAHKPGANCVFSTGESLDHMNMKHHVGKFFSARGLACQYEVRVIRNRIADVFIPTLRVVVECQESPISFYDLINRSHDYWSEHYSVLWVFSIARACDHWSFKVRREIRPPDEVRALHKELWGQVCVMNEEGELRVMHLDSATGRYNDYTGGSRYPKTLKNPSFRELEFPVRSRESSSGDLHFAMPANRSWWPKRSWGRYS